MLTKAGQSLRRLLVDIAVPKVVTTQLRAGTARNAQLLKNIFGAK
jgi:hypothetical protein